MEATTEHQLAKSTTTPLAALPPTDRAYLILSEKHSEQALAELAMKYVDVTEIKDAADYQLVKRGGIELMKARTSIEATGKAARDDANQFRKAMLAEEKRLILITLSEESRLKALRKDYDDEQDRIATEARLAEQRRIADITERIQAIKRQCDGLLGADSAAIQMRLDAVGTIVCNESLFAEFNEQAVEVKAATVETLELLLTARQEFEAQVEENQRIAQEQAERQAQLDQQAREQEARERAAQDKAEADEAVRQAERERVSAIQECIMNIRSSADGAAGLPASEIRDRLTAINQTDLSEEVWHEFQDKAKAATLAAGATLELALADRVKFDEDSAKLAHQEAEHKKAQEDRLAAERVEEERQAEAARQEALRPDKEKLMEWTQEIQNIVAPVITDIQLQSYRNSALERIHDIGEELAGYIEKF